MRLILSFLGILLLLPLSQVSASHNIYSTVKPLTVGSGQTSNYAFTVKNENNDSIYIIRIEAPINSGIEFSKVITCPEDVNPNDKYSWSFDWDSNHATCQTSANSDNPNLISLNETAEIVIRASVPNTNADKSFTWKIINENNIDFDQITSISSEVKIDATPAQPTKIETSDTNTNGFIDTVTLEFDDTIDYNAFSPLDFTINDNPANDINPNDDNSFNIIIDNPEINSNEQTIVKYNPIDTALENTEFEDNFSDLTQIVSKTDNIAPTVTYTKFSNNPPQVGENTVLIIFSEQMNISNIPEVSVHGVTKAYKLKLIEYTNNRYKGTFTLDQQDIIDINKVTILGAKDKKNNNLINTSGNIYKIITDTINTETNTNKISGQEIASENNTKSNIAETSSQIELIKNDSANIVNNKIVSWTNNLNTQQINSVYNTYTKNLINELSNVSQTTINSIAKFIELGTPSTKKLGKGERAGVLGSYKAAFAKLPTTAKEWEDILKIGNGRWPSERSTNAESRAKISFNTIYKRVADMSQPNDNAAVTVMAYGLRPSNRNLESERTAIKLFKKIFTYNPLKSTNWDAVRAIAYSGSTR